MTLGCNEIISMSMFSGIIEATGPILHSRSLNQAREIIVQRPSFFNDVKTGDSIAVNGVCLTVEELSVETMKFTLGFETLQVLGESFSFWLDRPVNLERSLSFGARVHGHLVTGHVEAMVAVVKSEAWGENWLLSVELPSVFKPLCWKKGSVTLNGVSLTINTLEPLGLNQKLEVCLIPETQKRTNLSHYKVGESLSFEPDSFAKAVIHVLSQREGAHV